VHPQESNTVRRTDPEIVQSGDGDVRDAFLVALGDVRARG